MVVRLLPLRITFHHNDISRNISFCILPRHWYTSIYTFLPFYTSYLGLSRDSRWPQTFNDPGSLRPQRVSRRSRPGPTTASKSTTNNTRGGCRGSRTFTCAGSPRITKPATPLKARFCSLSLIIPQRGGRKDKYTKRKLTCVIPPHRYPLQDQSNRRRTSR